MLSAYEMRMVGCFMAMHRDIFLKGSLQATVVGGDFISLKFKSFEDPTNTIQAKIEWHRVFYLLQVPFPSIVVFQLAQ
jgi:hypothetical protein